MPEQSAEEFHELLCVALEAESIEAIKARDAAIAAEARETAIEECIKAVPTCGCQSFEILSALRATPARAIGEHEGSDDG